MHRFILKMGLNRTFMELKLLEQIEFRKIY